MTEPGPPALTEWPLVGRSEELAFIRRAHRAGTSVVLTGAPGVGKSRLAAEVLGLAERHDGWVTLTVRVSPGTARVPFGGLRAALDVPTAAGGIDAVAAEVEAAVGRHRTGAPAPVPATRPAAAAPVASFAASAPAAPVAPAAQAAPVAPAARAAPVAPAAPAARVATAPGRPRRLLMWIDDAYHLDDDSAGAVHALAARGEAIVLATVRSGQPVPAAITALWKDGLAERLEIEPLSPLDLEELVLGALGGPVEESTVDRLWHVTEGNPLYLREVILASLETGALRQVGGDWRWRGGWARSTRLQEIVAERLGRLDAAEVAVMEDLAVGGTLPLELLVALGSLDALRRLEARALVSVRHHGHPERLEVAMTHPVHVEVIKGRLPALQVQSICRSLAEASHRIGLDRPSDQVRVARWSLEAGIPVDPLTLHRAAGATLWHVGVAIADRIQQIVPGAPGRPAPTDVAAPDPEGGIRLAETAYRLEGGVRAGTALAVALVWTGDLARAEAVLTEVADATDDDDRLRVAIALSHLQFWGRYRPDDALATLARAERDRGPDVSTRLLAELYEHWAGIELNVGRPAAALDKAERAAEVLGRPLAESPASPPAASALSMLGRSRSALALVDEAMPHALADQERPLAAAQLILTRTVGLARLGRLAEGLEVAEATRQVAVDFDSLDGTAVYGIAAGDALMLMGRPVSAARRYREAVGLLAERDVLGYRTFALAGLARAQAALGDEAGATAALRAVDEAPRVARYFDGRQHLARIALAALGGRPADAEAAARRGWVWAEDAGMVPEAALILEAWLRLAVDGEPAADLVAGLAKLAPRSDSPLVAAIAAHAGALAGRDAAALSEVADRLGAMGAGLMAAEAAARAALIHAERRRERDAAGASRAAVGWLGRCEGARSPVVERLSAPSILTRRELEVASLAAAGFQSKQIADRLVVSVRTVDAHLYRAYAKLGVRDRSGLAAVLSAPGPGRGIDY